MNNIAAIGYALLAAQKIGLKQDHPCQLMMAMHELMDEKTEEESADVCQKA